MAEAGYCLISAWSLISTKKVNSKTSPASAVESKSASINEPEPVVGEKPNGRDSCPFIPVIS